MSKKQKEFSAFLGITFKKKTKKTHILSSTPKIKDLNCYFLLVFNKEQHRFSKSAKFPPPTTTLQSCKTVLRTLGSEIQTKDTSCKTLSMKRHFCGLNNE